MKQAKAHLCWYNCITLHSILSDLTIDLPSLNLYESNPKKKKNASQLHAYYTCYLTSKNYKTGYSSNDLSLYRTGYIRVTPTKVLGTGPPLLLMHLNAKGAPKPLPVGNTKTKHEKSIVGKKDKQLKVLTKSQSISPMSSVCPIYVQL